MAIKYLVAGTGGTSNYGTTGAGSNWSLSSGGAGGQTPPTVSDDIICDGNSPLTLTIDTSARACKSITTTGWAGTLVMSQTLSVSGRIVLDATTTISGTGKLESIAAPALAHSLGTYVPNLGFRGAVTHTFDNIVSCGNLFIGSTTNATVLNTNWIEINGDLDLSLSSTAILSGTTVLKMVGTGQVKYPTSTGILRNDITIDTAGTITFATGTFRYNTGEIRHIAGTVDASGCDLNIVAATTLNCGSNVVWKTLNLSGTTTLTVTTSAYFSGLVTLGGTTLTTTINHGAGGVNLYAGGGLTINGTTGVIAGDCPIVLSGTGTFTVATTTGLHTATLYIDAGTGTVTTSGTIRYPCNKIKYVSGTVVTDAGTWASAGGSSGGSFAYVG
jgi:hypothetical protein